jgi:FMN-dependent NADH-azoreductase
MLTTEVINQIKQQYKETNVVDRNISDLPFLSEAAVEGMFIPETSRTKKQIESLVFSNKLIEELFWSDIIVFGVPIYNFNIPAALKAYLDLTVRIEKTFVHTEDHSKGLIHGKKAYVVITSAGTMFKSKVDFTTHYMEFILSFIGIKDATFINATNIDTEKHNTVLLAVKEKLEELVKINELKAVA